MASDDGVEGKVLRIAVDQVTNLAANRAGGTEQSQATEWRTLRSHGVGWLAGDTRLC